MLQLARIGAGIVVVAAVPWGARADSPTARFEWSLPERFGLDADGDGLTDFPTTRSYVDPSSWTVDFDACASTAGSSAIAQYDWDLAGIAHARSDRCTMQSSVFPRQGSYPVTLTVTAADGETSSVTQTITIKDLLIVSIGESNASGEGDPDVPLVLENVLGFDVAGPGPKWADQRCHRSAYSNHAQAAAAIERADPHTSVTFLGYACSGATIASGLLGPYDGAEPPSPATPHELLPAQVSAVIADVCRGNVTADFPLVTCNGDQRRIDALLVSIGGDDIGFGDLAGSVLAEANADRDPEVEALLAARLAQLPALYDQLGAALREKLDVDTVYIAEYPDPTTDEIGAPCANSPLGDLLSLIDAEESAWASTSIVGALNDEIREAAVRNHWQFVGGIASQFRGHGWCAGPLNEFVHDARWNAYGSRRRWINTYEDSRYTQGPFVPIDLVAQGAFDRAVSRGVMHPNAEGHAAIAAALVAHILDPGPSFAEFDGLLSSSVADRTGDDGWLTGSCGSSGGCSDQHVYLTVSIASANGIASPQPDACAASGISCSYSSIEQITGTGDHAQWVIDIAAEGEHAIPITARDAFGKANTFVARAKVDLHDPDARARVSSGVVGNDGWYRSPVVVNLVATDTASGIRAVTYAVDGGQSSTASPADASATTPELDVPVAIATDGRHVLAFRADDRAGRLSADKTFAVKVDATPPLVAYSRNAGTYTVDESVDISCTATDAVSQVASSTCAAIVGPAYSFGLGVSSFSASATDNAGNVGTGQTSFTVIVTPGALANLTTQFVADPGVAHSLVAKLAAGDVVAYVNELEALSGKKLSAQQAEILIRLAQAL